MSDKLFSNAPNRSNAHSGSRMETHDNQDQGEVDYIAALTKDGKAPTLEELAKKAFHADKHIANLESEQAGLREDLGKRLSFEELWEKIQSQQNRQPSSNQPLPGNDERPGQNEPTNKAPTAEELSRLIQETFNKESTRRTQVQNIQEARNALEATWGRDFEQKLLAKAKELGVDQGFLEDAAAKSPKAFLQLVGAAQAPTSQGKQNEISHVLPPNNQRNPSFGSNVTTGKNFKHFENLRKTDPGTYWSRETQRELHKAAAEMGDAFYR